MFVHKLLKHYHVRKEFVISKIFAKFASWRGSKEHDGGFHDILVFLCFRAKKWQKVVDLSLNLPVQQLRWFMICPALV